MLYPEILLGAYVVLFAPGIPDGVSGFIFFLPINDPLAVHGCHQLQVSSIEVSASGDVLVHPNEPLRGGPLTQLIPMVTSWVAIVKDLHKPRAVW